MSDWGPDSYGDRWADVYDDWVRDRLGDEATAATVTAIAELAPGRRILELGIGTGRLALPLVESGFEVHGIDGSPRMIERLRAKPGGESISVTMGDFADEDVDGQFDLVFVAFNTLFGLPSQDDQVRCFRNVADHLAPGGLFAVEGFVPDPTRFDAGQTVRALRVTADEVDLEASRHDPVNQTVTSQHVVITEQGIRLQPVRIRYAWPSELDLMARLAGLELRHRWAGWDRSPFTASSTGHVSIYGRAG